MKIKGIKNIDKPNKPSRAKNDLIPTKSTEKTRSRVTFRLEEKIINRIEALSSISGESKNSVANVLLAMQLGGVTCGATFENEKNGSNTEEPKESSVVHDDEDEKSSDECDVTSEIKNKRVSSPPVPPSPSQKKKGILRIPKKEKVSSQIGHGRKPKDFTQCLEYFKYRRIPNPEQKAREFYDFYDAKGWVVGKNPIKKWSCCLTTWISNNPGWEPSEEAETEGVSLPKVLGWMEKEHAEWFEKFKNAKKLGDIDGFYIDEFHSSNEILPISQTIEDNRNFKSLLNGSLSLA